MTNSPHSEILRIHVSDTNGAEILLLPKNITRLLASTGMYIRTEKYSRGEPIMTASKGYAIISEGCSQLRINQSRHTKINGPKSVMSINFNGSVLDSLLIKARKNETYSTVQYLP